jgi:hypothetical protein
VRPQYRNFADSTKPTCGRGARPDFAPATKRIVATPFPKFFNAGEHNGTIPALPFEVFEKVDGSLGILYHFDGAWGASTKTEAALLRTIDGVSVQPSPVLEKPSQGLRNLPVFVSIWTRWDRARVSEYIASYLNKLSDGIKGPMNGEFEGMGHFGTLIPANVR